jgi:hypothetical protein
MKLVVSIIVSLAVCGSVSAQTRAGTPYPSTAEVRGAGENALNRMAFNAYYGSGTRGAEKQCLTVRKTGRTVCKTQDDWKREATRIASAQRQDSIDR